MNRTRLVIGLQLGLGLICAGLGHYFTALFRTIYPLDGLVFYAAAVVCFVLAWRTAQREPNAVWQALIDLWRGAWREIRELLLVAGRSLRPALPYVSTRGLVILVVGVNVAVAILAGLFPAAIWLWVAAWGATLLALIAYVTPRAIIRPAPRTLAPPVMRTVTEPAPNAGERVNPIGWVSSIGFVLLGQLLLLLSSQTETTHSPLALLINDGLQLGLPGDAALIGLGVSALIAGTILFARVTRHAALSDYPPAVLIEVGDQRPTPWPLLAAALGGLALWVFALRSASGDPTGQAGTGLWLIALGIIAACWWQIDRLRGVRLGLRIDRREALWLALALVVMLVIFTFQLGQIPNSLWGDEGAFYTNARDLSAGVYPLGVFGLSTYAEPALTTIFQGGLMSLLGATLTAWRLSSVLAMWLAAVPLYFLARTTLGKRTAWIALAFYAVSPYVLTYARMGYDAAQAVWPVVLALALTWLAVRRDSRLYAFLAGAVAGLSFLVPASARIAIVIVPLWLIWMWIARRVSGTNAIGWQLGAVTLGMMIAAAPPIVNGLSNAPSEYLGKQFESAFYNVFYARDLYPEDQLFEWYSPISAGQQELFYAPQLYVPLIGRGVARTALAFHSPAVVGENFLTGSLADPFGVLYLLGLAWCCARFRRPGYAIWAIWLLLGGFLASALSTYPPRAVFLLPIVPALVTLGALGLTASIDVLAQLIGNVPERIKSYGLIGVTLLLALVGLRAYFVEMPKHFPPDLDNAVFWEAQSVPRGTNLTLIQPEGVPDNYMPWGVQQFDLGVNYHLVKKADLPSTDWRNLCLNGCRFVYVAADRDAVYPYLAQSFGEREPKEIRNADGSVQLYVYAP